MNDSINIRTHLSNHCEEKAPSIEEIREHFLTFSQRIRDFSLLTAPNSLAAYLESIKSFTETAWRLPSKDYTVEQNAQNGLFTIDRIIESTLNSIDIAFETLQSSAIKWLCSIDYSAIIAPYLRHNYENEVLSRYINVFSSALSESFWFPYPEWISQSKLYLSISRILLSSHGASKNREKRLDKVILSYYSPAKLKRIKKAWWNSSQEYAIRKTLCQSIDAFMRGEYVLTVSCLTLLWERLISEKIPEKKRNNAEKKEAIKALVHSNGYDRIIAEFYFTYIVSQCYCADDIIEGIPNRHGIAHGRMNKYPNKKSALNSILITDLFLSLEPKT